MFPNSVHKIVPDFCGMQRQILSVAVPCASQFSARYLLEQILRREQPLGNANHNDRIHLSRSRRDTRVLMDTSVDLTRGSSAKPSRSRGFLGAARRCITRFPWARAEIANRGSGDALSCSTLLVRRGETILASYGSSGYRGRGILAQRTRGCLRESCILR